MIPEVQWFISNHPDTKFDVQDIPEAAWTEVAQNVEQVEVFPDEPSTIRYLSSATRQLFNLKHTRILLPDGRVAYLEALLAGDNQILLSIPANARRSNLYIRTWEKKFINGEPQITNSIRVGQGRIVDDSFSSAFMLLESGDVEEISKPIYLVGESDDYKLSMHTIRFIAKMIEGRTNSQHLTQGVLGLAKNLQAVDIFKQYKLTQNYLGPWVIKNSMNDSDVMMDEYITTIVDPCFRIKL